MVVSADYARHQAAYDGACGIGRPGFFERGEHRGYHPIIRAHDPGPSAPDTLPADAMAQPLEDFPDPVSGHVPWGRTRRARVVRAASLGGRWHAEVCVGYPVAGLEDVCPRGLPAVMATFLGVDSIDLEVRYSAAGRPKAIGQARRHIIADRIRQGRRREIHNRRQPGAGARPRSVPRRWPARCGHLRAQPGHDAGRARRPPPRGAWIETCFWSPSKRTASKRCR